MAQDIETARMGAFQYDKIGNQIASIEEIFKQAASMQAPAARSKLAAFNAM
jgi:hypothetical protein